MDALRSRSLNQLSSSTSRDSHTAAELSEGSSFIIRTRRVGGRAQMGSKLRDSLWWLCCKLRERPTLSDNLKVSARLPASLRAATATAPRPARSIEAPGAPLSALASPLAKEAATNRPADAKSLARPIGSLCALDDRTKRASVGGSASERPAALMMQSSALF